MKICNRKYRISNIERYRKAKAIITALFGSFLTVTFGGLLIFMTMIKRGGFFIGGEWVLIIGFVVATVWQTIAAREAQI